jgi:hypothetical protein
LKDIEGSEQYAKQRWNVTVIYDFPHWQKPHVAALTTRALPSQQKWGYRPCDSRQISTPQGLVYAQVCQGISTLIARVSRMPLDPAPLNLVA